MSWPRVPVGAVTRFVRGHVQGGPPGLRACAGWFVSACVRGCWLKEGARHLVVVACWWWLMGDGDDGPEFVSLLRSGMPVARP